MRGPLALAVLLTARAAAAECARPTDPSGYAGYAYDAEVLHVDGDGVRVWYALSGRHAVRGASSSGSGVPEDVAAVAEAAERALAEYRAMGFRPPPPDTAAGCPGGGDARLDVYLLRFAGADGTTAAERCDASGAAPSCTSFVLAASDLSARYGTAAVGAGTVIPHEVFHAVQNAYDAEMDRYWAEGTAQWAAHRRGPTLEDFERFLPAFLGEDARPLDVPPSGVTAGYLYGSAIWPLFLSLRHDDTIVRAVLEAEATGATARDGVAAALEARGDSLRKAWHTFWEWNAGTGRRAADAGYPHAARYPEVPAEALRETANGVTAGTMARVYRLEAAGRRRVTLTRSTDHEASLLPAQGGRLRLDLAAPLPAETDGEAFVVLTSTARSNADAPYQLRIDPVAEDAAPPDAGCTVLLRSRERDPRTTVAVASLYLLGWRLFRRWRARRAHMSAL